jgi:hypothetical protein
VSRQARLRLPVWARRLLCIGALSCAVPGPARAQDTAGDAVVQQAKEHYRQGSEHARNGDWERACVSLKASLELVPHWSTAASLGQCELELGRFADAATHLDDAGRWLPFDATEQAHIDTLLKRARAQVASLDLQVNRGGATVLLDGETVGTAPIARPRFVMPGEHVATARVEGRPDVSLRFVVKAGERRTIALTLPEAVSPIQPVEAASRPGARDSGAGSSTKWIVLGTGAGLAVVATGAGVVFHRRAVHADDDAEVLRDQVGASGCYEPSKDLASKCGELSDLVDDRHENQRNATTAWASAGVLAAATAATWLLWPSDTQETPVVSAFAHPTGLGLAGRF